MVSLNAALDRCACRAGSSHVTAFRRYAPARPVYWRSRICSDYVDGRLCQHHSEVRSLALPLDEQELMRTGPANVSA
jgi:hypothetical protein